MIRKATTEDLDRILEIYRAAREFMRRSGNGTQWGDTYPPREVLESDILSQQLYVCIRDGAVCGVFAFITGDDPTYAIIEGAWKSEAAYGTIHRIASSSEEKGIFAECVDYCKSRLGHIRIDTHENNLVMQHLVAKHGFEKCGIIYLENGSPRIAYEYITA